MAFFKKKASQKKEDTTQSEKAAIVGSERVKAAGGSNVGVLMHPHITEKTAAGAHFRMYAFAVSPDANKSQVKKAVESKYGVNVTAVRMANIRGKEIHRGRETGWKHGMRKAYATLAEGQAIEIQ